MLSKALSLSTQLNEYVCAGGVVSYNSPEGSEPGQGLWDSSYDGERIKGELHGGLGRLVDGEIGADNFRLDIGLGKGKLISTQYILKKELFINKYVFSLFISCAEFKYNFCPDKLSESIKTI